jgi:hypothetical protein
VSKIFWLDFFLSFLLSLASQPSKKRKSLIETFERPERWNRFLSFAFCFLMGIEPVKTEALVGFIELMRGTFTEELSAEKEKDFLAVAVAILFPSRALRRCCSSLSSIPDTRFVLLSA